MAPDDQHLIKKEVRYDEGLVESKDEDSYENNLKSVEEINGRSLIFLQRKLRKYRITLKRELEFIRNRVLTVCINQKIYTSLKVPEFLIDFMEKGIQ